MLRILFVCSLIAAGATFAPSAASACRCPTQNTEANATKRARISIEGMTCGSCASRVTKALKALDGVVDVDVTVEPGEAKVGYDDAKITPDEMVEVINGLGYKAKVVG